MQACLCPRQLPHQLAQAPRVLLHAGLVVESSSNCTFDSLSIHGTGREGVRLRFNSTNNIVQASPGLEQGWGTDGSARLPPRPPESVPPLGLAKHCQPFLHVACKWTTQRLPQHAKWASTQ